MLNGSGGFRLSPAGGVDAAAAAGRPRGVAHAGGVPRREPLGRSALSRVAGVSPSGRLPGAQRLARLSGATVRPPRGRALADRKSTRLNSSHLGISYAASCLNKEAECRGKDTYRSDGASDTSTVWPR